MDKPASPPDDDLWLRLIPSDDPDPTWEEFVRDAIAERNLASELHKRLLAGAKNELFNEKLEPSLSPRKAAEFFAWLSHTERAGLPRVVKAGLGDLGVDRPSKKRDRPRGRKTDIVYIAHVQQIMQHLKMKRVFSKKQEIRKKHRHNWRVPFKKLLERERFPLEQIDFLTTSNSDRAFAIHMTASDFNVSYDAVDRACRRAAKAAKK